MFILVHSLRRRRGLRVGGGGRDVFFFFKRWPCSTSIRELKTLSPLNRPQPAILSILLCLTPDYFTLPNARRFFSSMGSPQESMGFNHSLKNYVPVSTTRFETRTATGTEHFACQDSSVFQIVKLITSNEERYLALSLRPG